MERDGPEPDDRLAGEGDPLHRHGTEAVERDAEHVGAGRESGEDEPAPVVGESLTRGPGSLATQRDGRAGKGNTRRVDDPAPDLTLLGHGRTGRKAQAGEDEQGRENRSWPHGAPR